MTEEIINTIIIVSGILGFGWIQRSFIGMVIKTSIQLLIKDSIDRERAQKALIFETIAVVNSNQPEQEDKDNIKTIPGINKLEDEISNLQNDFGIMLPLFNKELLFFKEEITKIVDASSCPPELREKCIEHFLEIKKMVDGIAFLDIPTSDVSI